MLAAASSLLPPLIWETYKVFALVFVLRVHMLSARIRRPLAVSCNEVTFPDPQLRGVITHQCSNSSEVARIRSGRSDYAPRQCTAPLTGRFLLP